MIFRIKAEPISPRSFARSETIISQMATSSIGMPNFFYSKGLISLPPHSNPNNSSRNRSIPVVKIDHSPLEGKLSYFPLAFLKLDSIY